jgi:hypothetical protein
MLPIPRSMANLPNLESIAAGWVSEERAKLDRARKAA